MAQSSTNTKKIAIAVLLDDAIWHFSAPSGQTVTIGCMPDTDFEIPGIDCRLTVQLNDSGAAVSAEDDQQTHMAVWNYPLAIGANRRLSLCFAIEDANINRFFLPDNGTIFVGRNLSTEERSDAVSLRIPFISHDHMRFECSGGLVTVWDNGSKNGLYLNGKRVSSALLKENDTVSICTVVMRYAGDVIAVENVGDRFHASGEILHPSPALEPVSVAIKRSPRVLQMPPSGRIDIPAPPNYARKPEMNWLATLLPTGATIGIAAVMTIAFNNSMMMIYSLPVTVAGVVVSITNYVKNRKAYSQIAKKRDVVYREELNQIIADIEAKQKEQIEAMHLADPDLSECLDIVTQKTTRLWSRKPEDRDFLSVRVGTGSVPFSVQINYVKQQLMSEDVLQKRGEEIYNQYNTIADAPVCVSIRNDQVCGVIGTDDDTRRLLQNMIMQLATQHCCSELKIICFYREKDENELNWIRNLPHLTDNNGTDKLMACTRGSASLLIKNLVDLLKKRKHQASENNTYGVAPLFLPYFLVVFFDPSLLERNTPLNQLLFSDKGLGAGCIMAVNDLSQLAKQCNRVIRLANGEGEVFLTDNAASRQAFRMDDLASSSYATFGRRIQPLFCDESIAQASLPHKYSFFEMLGIEDVHELDLNTNWTTASTERTLAAPIGIMENGDIISLDIHESEQAHGPHGLVAGQTGYGKSELLLTYILSMAVHYHPHDVAFVIIDFKSGNMAEKLKILPHVTDTITNMDGSELTRSVSSIGAEIRRRQLLFNNYNNTHVEDKKTIHDIYDYTEKRAEGKVTEPLPHIVVIVDEFAELKKDQPEFIKELISATRIGRSYGIHLILSTQNPSGQIDHQIDANMRFRICMHVAGAAESRDVIGTDQAASISVKGRAYLGIREQLLELFQSGFSGAPGSGGKSSTQLRDTIDAIADYCKAAGVERLPGICLPPLSSRIPLPFPNKERNFGFVPIGVRDDPGTQFQGDFEMDVFTRNTCILGSQLTGKTNLLQTIIRSAACACSPQDLNIYILDLSSMFLRNYEHMPHVGGVVTQNEEEMLTNLFKMLNAEMVMRRQVFRDLGIGSFAAYRQSGACDLPQILLVVDNLNAVRELFTSDTDPLLPICKDGLALGISVVATCGQGTGMGIFSYLPCFANRIALYCNDPIAYSTLFERCRIRPAELPGRSLIVYENQFYECQTYLAFASERETDRANEIKHLCDDLKNTYGALRAARIPCIPEQFRAEDLFSDFAAQFTPGNPIIGLDYATVGPVSLDFREAGVIAISGKPCFGKTNLHRYLITTASSMPNLRTEFYIVDKIDRKLESLANLPAVAEYTYLPDQAPRMLMQLAAKAEDRYQRITAGVPDVLDTSPISVLMINSGDAIDAICADKDAILAYKALTGKLKSMYVCIIFGNLDNAGISYSGPEILKKVRDDRKLIFFDDLDNLKLGDLPFSTVKQFSKPLRVGDCYVIMGNACMRVRVPLCPKS